MSETESALGDVHVEVAWNAGARPEEEDDAVSAHALTFHARVSGVRVANRT